MVSPLTLSDQKKQKFFEKCCIIPTKPKLTIRELASFIGTLTSLFPGNQSDPLYYRAILESKYKFLKYNKDNLNVVIKLPEDTSYEISWWKNNIVKAFKIRYPKISIIIYIDAPLEILSNNTTAIHYLNKMGTSHSMECDQETLKIWEWAIIHKHLLSAAHITGKLSTVVHKESRSIHVDTEWLIQSKVLNLALEHLCFKPEIDLFATNINTQFGKYAAFRSVLGTMYINAFSIDWSDLKFFTLPPI